MTRRVLYRHLLALYALKSGDVSAYWYLLPRKAKHSLKWFYWWQAERIARIFNEQYAHVQKMIPMIYSGAIEKISERDFRVPFQRIA